MSVLYLIVIHLVNIIICITPGISQSLQEWISYPIQDLNDESVQRIISSSIDSLSKRGVFHIPGFLSINGLLLFQERMSSIEHKRNRKERKKNVFQDSGDLNNFDSTNHARNYQHTYWIGFVGRSDLTKEFIDLYNYEPLLNFFREILINTHHERNDTLDCKTYSDLHRSGSKEGSVYAYIAQDHDQGAWHFDQHPFSCVWMISSPLYGGDLKYKFTPPSSSSFNDDNDNNYYDSKLGYDWDILTKIIIDKNEEYFDRLAPREGDLYCFKGNITVHMADQVLGDTLRAVFVTAYADYPNFTHIPEIDSMNAWGSHNQDKAEL